jgi:hypothetical protein
MEEANANGLPLLDLDAARAAGFVILDRPGHFCSMALAVARWDREHAGHVRPGAPRNRNHESPGASDRDIRGRFCRGGNDGIF